MVSEGQVAIWWVRRDFRLADNPAMRSAIDDGDAVLPLFVLDPALLESAGQARRKWLVAALSVLDRDLRDSGGPGLSVIRGKPTAVIPRLAKRHHAKRVHISADFGPYGRSRDGRVAQALGAGRHRVDSERIPVRRSAGDAEESLQGALSGVQPVSPRLGGVWRTRPGSWRTCRQRGVAARQNQPPVGGSRRGSASARRGKGSPKSMADLAQ